MRRIMASACVLTFVLVGCGNDELTLTEYVDTINTTVDRASDQFAEVLATPEGQVLIAGPDQLADFTPQDLQQALEQLQVIEIELLGAMDDIEPPEQVADLHRQWFDDQFTVAEGALAVRAATAATWEELSETPEMAAYRAALARDKRLCDTFQADLDATAARGAFADTPWIPGELKEVVEAALGCGGYPNEPNNAYRPLPAP